MTSSDREILLSINEQLVRMSVNADADKGFQTEVLTRLDNLEQTQSEVLNRLDKVEDTQASMLQTQSKMLTRLDNLETTQSKVLTRLDNLEQTTASMLQTQAEMTGKIDGLQFSFTIGFSVIAIVIALVGVFVPVYIGHLTRKSDKQAPAQSGVSIADIISLFSSTDKKVQKS